MGSQMPPEVPETLETPTTRMTGIFKCFLMFGLDIAAKVISTLDFNTAVVA